MIAALLSLVVLAAPAPVADAPDAGTPPAATPKNDDPIAKLPPAKPISFKAAVEKEEVELAQPFAVTIEVRHPASDVYSLPPKLDLKDFHVRSVKSDLHGTDPQTSLFRLELQAFAIGDVSIPAIHLPVQTPAGLQQLEIPPQKVHVTGVIDPSQGQPKMREDDRPLVRAYEPRWWPLFAMAGLVLLAGLAVWWRRRVENPPPPPPPKPRDPPDVEALARLAALEAEGLVAKGEKQLFYFRVTEIVRDYLGRRFGFDALELTTDELLHELRVRSTPGLDYDHATRFLVDGDLVKFARRDPTDGECKTALDDARLFVERTRPRPPVEGGAS